MRLCQFIIEQLPHIAKAWQARVETLAQSEKYAVWPKLPMHAKPILRAIASDLEAMPMDAHMERAGAHSSSDLAKQSISAVLSALKKTEASDTSRIVSELGALRSAVLKLSMDDAAAQDQPSAGEILQFNQLVDEALVACVAHFADTMSRGRNTLLSVLSHDLRTPLGGIKMAADYLSMTGQIGEKQAEAFDSIKRCILMMSATISDVSEYAKLSAGAALTLTARRLDVASLCRQAVSDASDMYPDCEFRFIEFGNPVAHADGERLRRAFSAILRHAVRNGTRQQPVEISVRDETDAVVIQVSSRTFIPDRELQAAFDPVTRVLLGQDHPESSSITNIGAGLFIANRIIAAHGGKIEASSSEEEGTIFKASIPRLAAEKPAVSTTILPIKA